MSSVTGTTNAAAAVTSLSTGGAAGDANSGRGVKRKRQNSATGVGAITAARATNAVVTSATVAAAAAAGSATGRGAGSGRPLPAAQGWQGVLDWLTANQGHFRQDNMPHLEHAMRDAQRESDPAEGFLRKIRRMKANGHITARNLRHLSQAVNSHFPSPSSSSPSTNRNRNTAANTDAIAATTIGPVAGGGGGDQTAQGWQGVCNWLTASQRLFRQDNIPHIKRAWRDAQHERNPLNGFLRKIRTMQMNGHITPDNLHHLLRAVMRHFPLPSASSASATTSSSSSSSSSSTSTSPDMPSSSYTSYDSSSSSFTSATNSSSSSSPTSTSSYMPSSSSSSSTSDDVDASRSRMDIIRYLAANNVDPDIVDWIDNSTLPKAVILRAIHDPNDAVAISAELHLISPLAEGYNLQLRRVRTVNELWNHLAESIRQGRPEVVVFDCHGTSDSVIIGARADDRISIHSEGDRIAATRVLGMLPNSASIILLSCNAGKGMGGSRNVTNWFSECAPHVRIISAQSPVATRQLAITRLCPLQAQFFEGCSCGGSRTGCTRSRNVSYIIEPTTVAA